MTKQSIEGMVGNYRSGLIIGVVIPLLVELLMTLHHEFKWSLGLLLHLAVGCLIGLGSGRLEEAALRKMPKPNVSRAHFIGMTFFVSLWVLGSIFAGRFLSSPKEAVCIWLNGWGIVRYIVVSKTLSRLAKRLR